MIHIVLVFIILGALAFLQKFTSCVKTNQPPGPYPFPFIGNVLQIGRQPHLKFSQWAKMYGPIVQFKIGFRNAIVLTDPKIAKEVLNDEDSTGRMTSNPVVFEFGQGKGIVHTDGPTWKAQRYFAIGVLRKLGLGSLRLEDHILYEAQKIVSWLETSEGRALEAHRMFQAPVLNTTWKIVAGQRFEWETSHNSILDSGTNFFQALMEVATNGLLLVPIMGWVAPQLFGWNNYKTCTNVFTAHLDQAIKEHKESFHADNLRDFIDEYISEINCCEDPKSSFYDENGYSNLRAVMMDLFVAGSETTSGFLSWVLLHLSQNQEAQRKLQSEIDRVINEQVPSLNHRQSMPYTQAVIMESLRISSVAALGVPHRILKDKIFRGYHIPKDTYLFVNLYGIDHSTLNWRNPDLFCPERFLNDDETKCIYPNVFLPFGDGKRKCIGENLFKSTAFLFITSIFQKYTVLPDPELGGKQPDMEPKFGLALFPKPHKILFSRR